MIGAEEITKRFTYHPPKEDQAEKFVSIRSKARQLADLLDQLVPDSREKSVAFTKLEEVVHWANAGIVRNE